MPPCNFITKKMKESNNYIMIFIFFVLTAEELGIKPNIPAYRDPNLKPEDLLTGVTFASGGAGYVPLTTKIAVLNFESLCI